MAYSWELQPDKLTPRFLATLVKWQSKGSRGVDIKLGHTLYEDNRSLSIWCYDYSVMEGCYVSKISEIPTTKQLAEMKRASIEKERAELQKKMDTLEVAK